MKDSFEIVFRLLVLISGQLETRDYKLETLHILTNQPRIGKAKLGQKLPRFTGHPTENRSFNPEKA